MAMCIPFELDDLPNYHQISVQLHRSVLEMQRYATKSPQPDR